MTYSHEHTLYLRRVKRKAITVHVARILLLLLLLGVWELSAATNLINPFITSSPSRIALTIVSLFQEGKLLYHVSVTLMETILGFLIAVSLGFVIALTLWWSSTLRSVLEPYIVILNALPKIALGPLLIIWCGTGVEAIVLMTVLVSIIVATMNLLNGFLSTDQGKLKLLKSMGASEAQILFKLVLPSSLPSILSMLKICVGMAWIGSIMGEYIVSKAGLGYLIVYGGQVFKLDLVMSATVILCALAGLMYGSICLLERLFLRKK